MPNSIAEYYKDELLDWKNSIHSNSREMTEFEQKLEDVIRRNSIVGIAQKVEKHQEKLNKVSKKLYTLQALIQKQLEVLKRNDTLLDDKSINHETEDRQLKLRSRMKEVEKEYIDAKYGCYNFLSGTLKK